MAKFDETFRVSDLPEAPAARSFDPVPEGVYDAVIKGAEIKTTKAGNGKYLAVRYDIANGDHRGRVVFANLTLRNPNIEAERIGRQQLGEMLQAIGQAEVDDSDELIGAELKIKVTIKQSEQYGASNEVKGWRPMANGVKPAAAPAAATGKAAPPWAKK